RGAIGSLETRLREAAETREAQRVLAREVTTLVHGAAQVARAEHASTLFFDEDITTLPADDVLAVFEDVPSIEVAASAFDGDGISVVGLVARAQLAASKAEARRQERSGGVCGNRRRISDQHARLRRDQARE